MKSRPRTLRLIVDTTAPATPRRQAAARPSALVREVTALKAKRIELDGLDELVLQCGKASITLRKDGRVVIRGTYVETHASGTNRIKGAEVKLN